MRPAKRPHKSLFSTVTLTLSWMAAVGVFHFGVHKAAPVMAETSRAIPINDKQSALLGVNLITKIWSSRSRYSRMSWPTGASAGNSKIPSWSSPKPSSRPEHNIPWLSTPRSLPTLIMNGLPPASAGGSSAPTMAQGILIPARAFGAPQTICNSWPVPASTLQTRKRSASGCCSADRICAITIFVKAGATECCSSTSRPAMVIAWPNAPLSSAGFTYWRSQDSENCIALSLPFCLSWKLR